MILKVILQPPTLGVSLMLLHISGSAFAGTDCLATPVILDSTRNQGFSAVLLACLTSFECVKILRPFR